MATESFPMLHPLPTLTQDEISIFVSIFCDGKMQPCTFESAAPTMMAPTSPVKSQSDSDDSASFTSSPASMVHASRPTTCSDYDLCPEHCAKHRGVKQCKWPACTRGRQSGGLCLKHGGGQRCSIPQCTNAAQSKRLCKKHGGGLRCQVDGCDKSSQGKGFCRNHGGGQRCAVPDCSKGTQRGQYCSRHGGYPKCTVEGCHRGNRGGGRCAKHRNELLSPVKSEVLVELVSL